MRQNTTVNHPDGFFSLTKEDQNILIEWIKRNLTPRKKENRRHTSYGLKHLFEADKSQGGFYVTNGEFKGAMQECGFRACDTNGINWTYALAERSIKNIYVRLI